MKPGPETLELLLEGNRRYVEDRRKSPNQSANRRLELTKGQSPHSIVLGCSDSRVPPEIIFDQGLGDLFVIRVAGNVVDDIVLGSIEYAAEHLGSSLLMVLGHSDCGAVKAAMDDTELDGHLPSIAEAIEEAVRKQGFDAELNVVVKTHAIITAEHLMESEPVLASLVDEGKLFMVAGYYDFESGLVEVLR